MLFDFKVEIVLFKKSQVLRNWCSLLGASSPVLFLT